MSVAPDSTGNAHKWRTTEAFNIRRFIKIVQRANRFTRPLAWGHETTAVRAGVPPRCSAVTLAGRLAWLTIDPTVAFLDQHRFHHFLTAEAIILCRGIINFIGACDCMEHHKLVMPEHMNHYGFLFGGNLLKWVDEVAWIAASMDYPSCHFVTIAMDNVEFRKSVRQGTILTFSAERIRIGNTSLNYRVSVSGENTENQQHELIFSTTVTFVRVDEQGRKTALPK